MTQRWAVRAVALGLAGLAGLAITTLIGCARGERQKQATADSTKQTAAASVSNVAVAGTTLPGALPQPLGQMTGDQLHDLAQRLQFVGGHERQRRCRGSAECRGPNPRQFTRLAIAGVDQEDSLGMTNLPPNGVIAARLLNRGQMADTMYGARPGYEYYLIVIPSADSAPAWRLEEVTTAAPRQHHSIAIGKLKGCGHSWVAGARADFKTCAQSAAEAEARGHASLLHPVVFRPMQLDDEPPIWFGCSLGCCTADAPG